MSQRRTSTVIFITLLLAALVLPQAARAGFTLGDAANFAVLYEGTGGNTLNFSNSNISGNIGIGGTGKWADAGGCAPTCFINGVVEFSAANTGQFSSSAGTKYTPALAPGVNPTYNDANVQTDLNNLNSLSTNLGTEAGTSLTISSGGSVNASSGTMDLSGNDVFTLLSGSNFPNGNFTITGTSSQFVVINVPFAFAFNGSIVLSGGLISDHVLFNLTGTNHTLTINTNGATTDGTFLDPNGAIQINHSILDGRLFGGDSQNMQIVSGANINAPPIPEPAHTAFILALLMGIAIAARRRLTPTRTR
jgi:hypothetical protein